MEGPAAGSPGGGGIWAQAQAAAVVCSLAQHPLVPVTQHCSFPVSLPLFSIFVLFLCAGVAGTGCPPPPLPQGSHGDKLVLMAKHVLREVGGWTLCERVWGA